MLSDFDRAFLQADTKLFDAFGVKGVFNDSIVIDVTLERDVVRDNGYGESIRRRFEITVRNAEVGKLRKGDTVDIGADRYEITEIVLSDENVTVGEAVSGS